MMVFECQINGFQLYSISDWSPQRDSSGGVSTGPALHFRKRILVAVLDRGKI